MNKKKAVKLGIITGIIVLLGIIGVLGVQKMTEPTEKEKQITFLKEHADEMTEYIKKYSSKNETVAIHWDTVTVDESVAFSSPVLTVEFDISNSSEPKYDNQGYILRIDTDIEKLSDINELMILNDPIYSNIKGEKNG
ncbi:hypothetical protein JZO73_00995 [Enterococcus plantarum]|uniref:hypothetical protein n=1 Tax=Enterococcus plantarum TaxID=1077675 RepID=UPI001A8E61FF|nr:hypothetical protein [Enterococcus plantarum]MBO0466105.1 hypothetical protein [Enterococcus plantarum]